MRSRGRIFAGLVLIFLAGTSRAADISWSGLYRVEGVKISDAELDSMQREKAYLIQHMILRPKIAAADGVTLFGRFDIFNNSTYGRDNGMGDALGAGPRRGGTNPPAAGSDSNVMADRQATGSIAVSELYASWVHEYGQLVVGRAPLQFGLGTTFSSGQGNFDHWYTNRDMVGYKFVVGSLFFMPILAKVDEGDLSDEDDVNDYMVHVQYDNKDTDLSLGLLFDLRVATQLGNDAPSNSFSGTKTGGFKTQLISLYSSQKVSNLTIGVEADMLKGSVGMTTATGRGEEIDSYGIAAEVKYNQEGVKWEWLLKTGVVSGDDPGTDDQYEGYIFNRNYDVAMLMFNHPLGNNNVDFFRTGMVRDQSKNSSYYPDTEALSNALYLAPSFHYKWKDNLSLGGTFVWASLNKEPVVGGSTNRTLGYETDLSVTYRPFDRLTWLTEFGFLVPGEAWKAGARAYENRTAYGIVTKAAISF